MEIRPSFSWGEVANNAFRVYPKIILTATLTFILFIVLVLGLAALFFPMLFPYSMEELSYISQKPEQLVEMLSVVRIRWGIFLFSLLLNLIFAPISAMLFGVTSYAEQGRKIELPQIVALLDSSLLLRLLVYTLIITLVNELVSYFPFLSLPIQLYVLVCTMFVVPLLIFERVSLQQAFVQSWCMSNKRFFPMLCFLVVLLLFIFSGAVFCGVGLLFTLPMWYAAIYTLYISLKNKDNAN